MSDVGRLEQIERRLAATEREIEQGRERLKQLQARASQLRRSEETRRKIIYGAALLTLLETMNKDDRGVLRHVVLSHVTRKADRDFLGLTTKTIPAPPTSADAPTQVEPSSTSNLALRS